MIAPVILAGRILQREAMAGDANNEAHWDSPLPESIKAPWNKWKEEVKGVRLSMPRCIFPDSVTNIHLHVFADASSVAIGFVIYATSNDLAGNKHTSFILAGSKVAPRAATTIPRLELCAALEASIAVNNVIRELHVSVSKVTCYTDSQIVLGYLKNHQKSFTRYVSRRIDSIMRICPCGSNWLYVPTSENPADYASRPTHPSVLLKSNWFTGSDFLKNDDQITIFNHQPPCDNLPELVPEQKVLRTNCTQSVQSPISALVERLSSWPKCVKTVQLVLSLARHWSDKVRQKKGTSLAPRDININVQAAINVIVSESQHESFPEVLRRTSLDRLPEDHSLSGLSVFKDEFGLLRVGGRLKNAVGSYEIKHPLILSDKHPLSTRIAQYYHEVSGHQGRIISHASVRNNGYFIIKGKRLINNIISSCTFCKRLRGNTSVQLMSDLPIERVTESTPFENVGIDVFGPFLVHDGIKTRKSPSTKKMYGLLITCLASRAVHVEPLVGLDTPSFINAMRRFSAIRGACKSILSGHGTNFVGALSSSIDFEKVERDALNRGCIWKMNPPGASHFGGVYERKIGSVRRILESFFAKHSNQCLSRDEMNTLLQEAVSIINATPLYGITDDPNDPYPITPSMILTLKVEPSCASKDTFVSSDVMSYGKNRWKKVQFIADQFWDNWRKFYLSELVERRKWRTIKTPIQVGDVVIVKCKNVPRNQWILGLVTQTIKGTDNCVRRVLLKVCPNKGRHRIAEKAIHDLVLLCPQQDTIPRRECAVTE